MEPKPQRAEPTAKPLRILLVSGTTNVGLVSKAEFLHERGHEVSVLLEELHAGTESLGTGAWAHLWNSGAITVRPKGDNRLMRASRVARDLLLGGWTLLSLKRQSSQSAHGFPSGFAARALTAWTTRQIHRLAREREVVHVRDGAPARRVAAGLDLYDHRAALIVSFLGLDLISLTPDERQHRYRGVFDRAQALTVATHHMRDLLLAGGAPTGRVSVIPSTIDIGQCPTRTRRFAEDGVIRLISVGRLIPYKGFADSISALKHLVEDGQRAELVILGSGPLLDELRSVVKSLEIGDLVQFRGREDQSTVYRLMSESDVLVHPALTLEREAEAMGLVSLEAQQIGLHVIVTESGGLPETVVPGVSGLVVPERNPAAIAEGIKLLHAENDDARGERIDAGRRHIGEFFTIQSQGSKLEKIYRSPEDAVPLA